MNFYIFCKVSVCINKQNKEGQSGFRNRTLTYKLLYFKSINRRFSPENDDICHVNDLYIANDKLYVSMFSYPPKKNPLSFANKTNLGVILEYSLQERKVVKICHDKLLQPHRYFIMIIRCFIVFQVNS